MLMVATGVYLFPSMLMAVRAGARSGERRGHEELRGWRYAALVRAGARSGKRGGVSECT
jgi:hypothetical protein